MLIVSSRSRTTRALDVRLNKWRQRLAACKVSPHSGGDFSLWARRYINRPILVICTVTSSWSERTDASGQLARDAEERTGVPAKRPLNDAEEAVPHARVRARCDGAGRAGPRGREARAGNLTRIAYANEAATHSTERPAVEPRHDCGAMSRPLGGSIPAHAHRQAIDQGRRNGIPAAGHKAYQTGEQRPSLPSARCTS